MSRDGHLCIGCDLRDERVEAGGIYFCPNKFCPASGAWNVRLKAGYQDAQGEQSDEQARRMYADLLAELEATGDANLKAVLATCKIKLEQSVILASGDESA